MFRLVDGLPRSYGDGSSVIFLVLASAMVLMVSGCATVMDGTSQNVTFNSYPNGVKLFHNGVQIGVTPLTADLDRSDDTVILAKGRLSRAKNTTANKSKFMDMGEYNLLRLIRVRASGAVIEYSPNTYYVTLEPKDSPQHTHTQDVPLDNDKKVRGTSSGTLRTSPRTLPKETANTSPRFGQCSTFPKPNTSSCLKN
jgi:hypothetical protein